MQRDAFEAVPAMERVITQSLLSRRRLIICIDVATNVSVLDVNSNIFHVYIFYFYLHRHILYRGRRLDWWWFWWFYVYV